MRVRSATGPGASGGSGSAASALVGTWTRSLLLQHGDDFTRSTTTWHFFTGGACERAVETFTLSAGFADTTHHPCSYVVEGAQVRILYDGTPEPVTFAWHIQGGVLTLGGVEFQRA